MQNRAFTDITRKIIPRTAGLTVSRMLPQEVRSKPNIVLTSPFLWSGDFAWGNWIVP